MLCGALMVLVSLVACAPAPEEGNADTTATSGRVESRAVPEPQYTLGDENTHNKFGSAILPTLRVPSGAVVEVLTQDHDLDVRRNADNLDRRRSRVATLWFDYDYVSDLEGKATVSTLDAIIIHDASSAGSWFSGSGASPCLSSSAASTALVSTSS